ncbi:zinc finger BED domain-containing protein RICESLEEPER 2-like isoform X2 [Mangifera indica]|nr:zinc finger BED domain-containing protein RICESLEEPER 2-like isoform X2 [Mangifera indica]
MTSEKIESSGANPASSQASTAKAKSVEIEAPIPSQMVAIDDLKVDMTSIEDFDASTSNEEDEAHVCSKGTIEAAPFFIPSNKRRKTIDVLECFPEKMFVNVGDAKSNVFKYCKRRLKLQKAKATTHLTRHMTQCVNKKKALGKNVVVGEQTILCFQPSNLELPNCFSTSTVLKTSMKYEHSKVRKALAHLIMTAELPINIVERVEFNNFCRVLQPLYEKVERKQVKTDCFRVYQAESVRLKKTFEEITRISITTDLWKSDTQNIEYMIITAHWVDQSWSLNKRLINFVHLPPPRRGIDIASTIFECLKSWEIHNKVQTITMDNASANDSCIKRLKEDFEMQRPLLCDGKLFHVRCTAHIVNLLVQDGVAVIKPIIDNIRESVKFIRASEARQKIFSNIAMQCGIKERKLILDYPTRWNSTYKMLTTALQFKDVFPRYMFVDSNYTYCPTREEWDRLEVVCDFLEIFDVITKLISGSQYTTSNRYFMEVFRIKEILKEREFDEDRAISKMVSAMSEKFNKYWGNVNFLMAIASIMDPRIKFLMITLAFPILYGEENAPGEIENVKRNLEKLYNEYVDIMSSENPSTTSAPSQYQTRTQQTPSTILGNSSSSRSFQSRRYESGYSWLRLKEHKERTHSKATIKSELEIYFEERSIEIPEDVDSGDFNVLHWWRDNQYKYKVLSRMAADILTIPISTVASESTFSAGNRVIDTYKSSLSPETVNMLMCGADWMRALYNSKKQDQMRDEVEDVELILPDK